MGCSGRDPAVYLQNLCSRPDRREQTGGSAVLHREIHSRPWVHRGRVYGRTVGGPPLQRNGGILGSDTLPRKPRPRRDQHQQLGRCDTDLVGRQDGKAEGAFPQSEPRCGHRQTSAAP